MLFAGFELSFEPVLPVITFDTGSGDADEGRFSSITISPGETGLSGYMYDDGRASGCIRLLLRLSAVVDEDVELNVRLLLLLPTLSFFSIALFIMSSILFCM